MRILVFGDSIAHGMWDMRGGWVQSLRRDFDSSKLQDYAGDYPDVYNLGVSDDTSSNVVARMEAEITARARADVAVVVAIGTNDSSASNVHVELPDFKANLEKIIAISQKFTNKLLFVGLPSVNDSKTNPWFVDPSLSFSNASVQSYEQAIQEICSTHVLSFIPVFAKFQAEQANRDLLPDGLHPNGAGHEIIAELVRPVLHRLIEAQ